MIFVSKPFNSTFPHISVSTDQIVEIRIEKGFRVSKDRSCMFYHFYFFGYKFFKRKTPKFITDHLSTWRESLVRVKLSNGDTLSIICRSYVRAIEVYQILVRDFEEQTKR